MHCQDNFPAKKAKSQLLLCHCYFLLNSAAISFPDVNEINCNINAKLACSPCCMSSFNLTTFLQPHQKEKRISHHKTASVTSVSFVTYGLQSQVKCSSSWTTSGAIVSSYLYARKIQTLGPIKTRQFSPETPCGSATSLQLIQSKPQNPKTQCKLNLISYYSSMSKDTFYGFCEWFGDCLYSHYKCHQQLIYHSDTLKPSQY